MMFTVDFQKLPDWKSLPELSPLLDLSAPPKELFYQGTWNTKIFQNCTAIVGSRKMTDYGRIVLEKLIPALVFAKKTIVSGFMYGVDQYAHQLAINQGGKTVAVLGWGIKEPLFDYDRKLAKQILESGSILLSEWENQKATLWTFPRRNRIIAGLCDEVFIVEAGPKSGSLITAQWAIKLKRKLFAVPGPITSRTSVGTNELIAAGSAISWLGTNPKISRQTNGPLLNAISNEPLTANDIARKLNLPITDVGVRLSMLVLTGEVIDRNGKFYANQD